MTTSIQIPQLHIIAKRQEEGVSGVLAELRKSPRSPYYPHNAASCAEQLARFRFDLSSVSTILRRQAATFGAGEASLEAIEALANGALCVFTGQQCGFFGGPLFTVTKAMAAIATARRLTRELGQSVVPCFWLAADDHDFREIAVARFLGPSGIIELELSLNETERNLSIGAMHLTDSIQGLLAQLEEILPQGVGRDGVLWAVQEAYQPGATLAEGFARLFARLLAPYPIIIVNPHDDELKRLALPVFQRELREAEPHNAALLANAQDLKSAGYHPQVQVAAGKANLFYHTPQRFSVLHKDGKCWCSGADEVDLEAELLKYPERFSPNVLLRPVVQDTLFPTVAYVGGAAECAYFAQVSALYAAYGRPMPEIICRPQVTMLEEKQKQQIEKLGISIEDLAAQDDRLLNSLARERVPADLLSQLAASRQAALDSLDALTDGITAFEPTLRDTAQTARGQIERQFENLEKKLTSSAKRKADDLTQRVRLLQQQLMPHGVPQERYYSALPWLAKYGTGILDYLLENLAKTA